MSDQIIIYDDKKRMADRLQSEINERERERRAWNRHVDEVDRSVKSISASEMPGLIEQYNREHPHPFAKTRTIDPAIHHAFREWLWSWKKLNEKSAEILK